jgi:hypothetical protein
MVLIALAASFVFWMCGTAAAFEIQTGNEDVKINWDNTIRYNLGHRIGTQDKVISKIQLNYEDTRWHCSLYASGSSFLSPFSSSRLKPSVSNWSIRRAARG